MYLAMARVAHREGYPEIGLYWEKAAYEEAEHAAKFAELLGEVVTDSTKKNLEMRVDAENGATAGKFDLAKQRQGSEPGCHPRHRARDGSRRGPPRQGFRGPAEPLFRQIRADLIESLKREQGDLFSLFLLGCCEEGAQKEDGTACTVLFS